MYPYSGSWQWHHSSSVSATSSSSFSTSGTSGVLQVESLEEKNKENDKLCYSKDTWTVNTWHFVYIFFLTTMELRIF